MLETSASQPSLPEPFPFGSSTYGSSEQAWMELSSTLQRSLTSNLFQTAAFSTETVDFSAENDALLLIADSVAGSIVRLNVLNGRSATIIQDPSMMGDENVGINGIHVKGDELYFTNFAKQTFNKITINLTDEMPIGPVVQIVNNTLGDDFILSEDGKFAYVAQNTLNTLARVDIAAGSVEIVAGSLNSMDLPTVTAVALGRGLGEWNILYASSGGTIGGLIDGNLTSGGRVVRIDLPVEGCWKLPKERVHWETAAQSHQLKKPFRMPQMISK